MISDTTLVATTGHLQNIMKHLQDGRHLQKLQVAWEVQLAQAMLGVARQLRGLSWLLVAFLG